MDLTHRFTVPTTLEETWAHFGDIAAVGQCFPGATVTDVDGDTFKGTVKVKLGPIAMVYGGTGTFVEKDDAAHRFVVDAKGKDKRGNGTAGAKVTLSMADAAAGGTDVEVVTDLAVTGKPAQFGRGVMQDVSDKLLGQFVSCLEQRLAGSPEPASEPEPASASASESAPAPVSAPVSAPAPVSTANGRHSAAPAAAAPSRPPQSAPPTQDDALDLGATVLPVLIKSYWKQGAVGVAVVLVIVWLISR